MISNKDWNAQGGKVKAGNIGRKGFVPRAMVSVGDTGTITVAIEDVRLLNKNTVEYRTGYGAIRPRNARLMITTA